MKIFLISLLFSLNVFSAGINTSGLALTMLTATSSVKTPTASGNYDQMTTNSLVLTTGTWELTGGFTFTNGGTTPTYAAIGGNWFGANGADSVATPAALTTVVTTNSAFIGGSFPYYEGLSTGNYFFSAQIVTVTVTGATATVFLVPFSNQTTSSNARITVYATARKLY